MASSSGSIFSSGYIGGPKYVLKKIPQNKYLLIEKQTVFVFIILMLF